MAYGIIYKYTNRVNGRVYIGQTRVPEKRKSSHDKAVGDSAFHTAIRYWGVDRFDYEVLQECASADELNRAETEQIKLHKSNEDEFGYNQTSGGAGDTVWTKEAKENASAAQTLVRSQRIRELADKCYTITDISSILCLTEHTIRRIAEETNIDILDSHWASLFRDAHTDYVREGFSWHPTDIVYELDTDLADVPAHKRKIVKAIKRGRFQHPDPLLVEEYSPKLEFFWQD